MYDHHKNTKRKRGLGEVGLGTRKGRVKQNANGLGNRLYMKLLFEVIPVMVNNCVGSLMEEETIQAMMKTNEMG